MLATTNEDETKAEALEYVLEALDWLFLKYVYPDVLQRAWQETEQLPDPTRNHENEDTHQLSDEVTHDMQAVAQIRKDLLDRVIATIIQNANEHDAQEQATSR